MSNVKNAPEGRYFVECGWSDRHPWVVVKESPSGMTLTVVPVEVVKDPEFKPNFLPGGFAGHCDNQHEQTWLYAGTCPMRKKTIRLGKKGWASGTFRETHKGPVRFYDYNF